MNNDLFLLINHLAGKNWLLDETMVFAARGLIWVLIFGILIFLAFKQKRRGIFYLIITLILTVIGSWLLEYLIGFPRPVDGGSARLLISSPPTNSFPSTHTALAFAAAGSIFLYQRFLGFFGMIIAAFVGLSRIFVGVHYPEDIVAGAFWGIIVAGGCYYLLSKRLKISLS